MVEPLSHIKTNIITGFLGAGKSTAILNLLQQKPDNERWAILVNEFGEVGIDGGLLQSQADSGTFIREVPGGCMCCAAGLPMQIAMNMLLAKARPDRLIIEPTGLGHPFEVMSILAADHYQKLLDLHATLTLVDARKISDKRYTNHDTFNQQLGIADIIVASKRDLYAADDLMKLENYLVAKDLLPERQLLPTSGGRLEMSWLSAEARAWKRESTTSATEPKQASEDAELQFPPEGFIRLSNHGEGFASNGWVFEPTFTFRRDHILDLFQNTQVDRLKAVLKTDVGNLGFNFAGDDVKEIKLRELEDSRIEIISAAAFNSEAFEANLLKICSR